MDQLATTPSTSNTSTTSSTNSQPQSPQSPAPQPKNGFGASIKKFIIGAFSTKRPAQAPALPPVNAVAPAPQIPTQPEITTATPNDLQPTDTSPAPGIIEASQQSVQPATSAPAVPEVAQPVSNLTLQTEESQSAVTATSPAQTVSLQAQEPSTPVEPASINPIPETQATSAAFSGVSSLQQDVSQTALPEHHDVVELSSPQVNIAPSLETRLPEGIASLPENPVSIDASGNASAPITESLENPNETTPSLITNQDALASSFSANVNEPLIQEVSPSDNTEGHAQVEDVLHNAEEIVHHPIDTPPQVSSVEPISTVISAAGNPSDQTKPDQIADLVQNFPSSTVLPDSQLVEDVSSKVPNDISTLETPKSDPILTENPLEKPLTISEEPAASPSVLQADTQVAPPTPDAVLSALSQASQSDVAVNADQQVSEPVNAPMQSNKVVETFELTTEPTVQSAPTIQTGEADKTQPLPAQQII